MIRLIIKWSMLLATMSDHKVTSNLDHRNQAPATSNHTNYQAKTVKNQTLVSDQQPPSSNQQTVDHQATTDDHNISDPTATLQPLVLTIEKVSSTLPHEVMQHTSVWHQEFWSVFLPRFSCFWGARLVGGIITCP